MGHPVDNGYLETLNLKLVKEMVKVWKGNILPPKKKHKNVPTIIDRGGKRGVQLGIPNYTTTRQVRLWGPQRQR